MPEFMVALRGSDPELRKCTAEVSQKLTDLYGEWVERLKRERRYRGGAPLKEGSKLLSRYRDFVMIMDGPFQKTNDALTGYFVIEAGTMEEAVGIARECPALAHGETVEIIELQDG